MTTGRPFAHRLNSNATATRRQQDWPVILRRPMTWLRARPSSSLWRRRSCSNHRTAVHRRNLKLIWTTRWSRSQASRHQFWRIRYRTRKVTALEASCLSRVRAKASQPRTRWISWLALLWVARSSPTRSPGKPRSRSNQVAGWVKARLT